MVYRRQNPLAARYIGPALGFADGLAGGFALVDCFALVDYCAGLIASGFLGAGGLAVGSLAAQYSRPARRPALGFGFALGFALADCALGYALAGGF